MNELDFAKFFRDVHGYAPLPWQERLAEKLINDHAWPDLIDLPTASGKTACIDIALFHLAWCAERGEPWRAARRIVFVVDRRIIVDAAADRSELLRANLEEPRTETIRRVAAALAKLGGAKPLVCEKLRGGMPRERAFTINPVQPMVVTSTVDQVGSRLLFRGYGLSPYSLPIHAGLLAFDSLLLVDEAHLSQPFIDIVNSVRRYQLQATERLGRVQPVRLVPLSATAWSSGNKFQLDANDHDNRLLSERRLAPKPATLVEAGGKFSDRLKVLLAETLALADTIESSAPAIAVVVNRVRTARALFAALTTHEIASSFDVELLIGRSRPIDRDVVAKRVIESVGVAHRAEARERGIIVVATQTIEVGADLDFQGLVTECAALDALRQRFGRLDRLGRFGRARAVVVGSSEIGDDPVYGQALDKTWAWLNDVAATQNGVRTVDFSIASMDKLAQRGDLEALASPAREQIVLTPLHIDLLCQTSPTPMYSPDVPVLLHGLGATAPDVQIVWRSDLPVVAGDTLLDERRLDVARALLDLNPPTSLESLSLPLGSVRSWLMGSSANDVDLVDIEGAVEGKSEAGVRGARWVLRREQGDQGAWVKAHPKDIRPGDTIVVPTVFGGCDEFGFAPSDSRPVRDLSAVAREKLNKSAQVVITAEWIERLGLDPEVAHRIWNGLCEALRQEVPPRDALAGLIEALDELLPETLRWVASAPVIDVIADRNGSLFALVLTERRVRIGDISDEDLSSSYTVPVGLGEHSAGVAHCARSLAQALALEPHHVEHVALAGQLHDVGKADPRFQQMLRSGDGEMLPGVVLAKGLRRSRLRSHESTERHEAYSVAIIDRYPGLLEGAKDRELVRYLVGTHHGRGRALMPDRDDEGTTFDVEIAGQRYSYDGSPALGALQAGWSSSFWRLNQRYGPWGLAYLESILRLADWLRSAEELVKEEL
jgi:CRISPR-associated endonuclease/helicase Cas3